MIGRSTAHNLKKSESRCEYEIERRRIADIESQCVVGKVRQGSGRYGREIPGDMSIKVDKAAARKESTTGVR